MDAFLPEHNEEKLLLFGYAIASPFFISVLRGLYFFLKTGNPCDFVCVIGCTVSLGVLWQTGPQLIDDTVNPITSTSPLPPITAAQNLFHQSLTIVDMHADSLLWSYRISTYGQARVTWIFLACWRVTLPFKPLQLSQNHPITQEYEF